MVDEKKIDTGRKNCHFSSLYLCLARWIADGEILAAPLVALLLIFPTRAPSVTAIGSVALVGVWLVRWSAQGYPWRRTSLNLAPPLFFSPTWDIMPTT